jgi:CRISPR-associated protein Csd1
MQRFVQKPVETWKQLYIKLIPYINKLEEKASYYQYLIGEIESKFIKEERLEQKALSYKFLCGFSSQRQKFFNRKNTDDSKELDINDEVVAFEESNLERSENAYNNTDKSLDSSKEEYLLPSDTSGLYGCLLAIADIVEFKALGDRYKGTTNALRLMESFSMKPVSTWKNIHDKLIPYFSKINMGFYKLCFRKIESSFDIEERQRNEALKDNFIYEYSRMRYALLHKKLSVSKQKAVEIEKITRDLAYGKLLSIENAIEILRINKNLDAKSKQSNSIKYMTAFSQKPNSVWNNVFRQRLKPFENKWIMKNNKYAQHLKKMEAIIKENCWDTDEPLGGSYLNGFYSNNNIKILEEIQNE